MAATPTLHTHLPAARTQLSAGSTSRLRVDAPLEGLGGVWRGGAGGVDGGMEKEMEKVTEENSALASRCLALRAEVQ